MAKRNRTPCATLTAPIWRKQPRETSLSYAAFKTYRDLGERRTLRATAEKLSRSATVVEDRARRWRWQERCEAFDLEMEELALETQRGEIAAMNRRHATVAVEGLKRVLQRITGDDDAGVAGINVSKLTAQDCARLVEVLSKLERLSRGAESERIETRAGQPVRIALGFDATPNVQGVDMSGFVEPESPN
jgi:hypothetical protein